jgi:ATP-binding cassette, subfamily B, bacterial PglK
MSFYNNLKIIFNKKEQKELIFLFIGILFMGFLEVVGVASIGPFMAIISTPELIHENKYLSFIYVFVNAKNDQSFIILIGVSVIVVLLFSNVYQAYMTWKITHFTQFQASRLSTQLLRQYLMQPYSFFLNKNTSELGKNILNEVSRAVGGVVLQALLVLSKVIITVFLFILLLLLDPVIAVISLIILGSVYAILFRAVKDKLGAIGRLTVDANTQAFRHANEAMSGIKDIKLLGRENEFVSRFSNSANELSIYNTQSSIISMLPRYLLEVIAFGGIISIVIFLISSGVATENIIPIVAIYAMAGYRLLPALQQIYSGLTSIRFTLPAFDILASDLSKSFDTNNKATKNDFISFNNYIQLKDISYSYPGVDNNLFSQLNLTIKANTTIAFIGKTGSGKTTLVDIILGLLTPQSGSIVVDGMVLGKSNISSWQGLIGYVPQSIYLSDDSIANNIAFALSGDEVDIQEVKVAAKIAKIDDFIESLPNQYETVIGERGVRLSGGQRQRIGIARALYHNPPILVLDEATSALDGDTESAVMEAVEGLSHKKTIIIIAHRLTTTKNCDYVYSVNDGSVYTK